MIAPDFATGLGRDERPEIDPKTGAPRDYEALLKHYHHLVVGMATSLGIPAPDREDACAEVEIRFWKWGGLDRYDPTLQVVAPVGGWRDGKQAKVRTARFATLYRRFVYLHMLAERDRHLNRNRRLVPTDMSPNAFIEAGYDTIERDETAVIDEASFCEDLTARMRAVIADADPGLLPVLEALLASVNTDERLTKAALGKSLQMTSRKASEAVQRVLSVLSEAGLSPATIRQEAS